MSVLVFCLVIILLGIITYQDFRYRAVYWILFPPLALLFALADPDVIFQKHYIVNFAFLVFILMSLTIWFSAKERKLVLLTVSYLGLGDILFLSVICFAFSPLNYILFFTGSLLSVILAVAFFRKLSESIPLAGIQSFLLVLILFLKLMVADFSLLDDTWIINLL